MTDRTQHLTINPSIQSFSLLSDRLQTNDSLMCIVSYCRPEGDQRHIRRFFKVIVENPFVFSSSATQVGDATLLEVQLKNVAKSPIYLGSVNFVAQPHYSVSDLNHPVFETASGVRFVVLQPQRAQKEDSKKERG